MTIRDFKIEDIHVGMKIKSLISDRTATIIRIDKDDDNYSWIQWDDTRECNSGFYGNDNDCEVVSYQMTFKLEDYEPKT